MLFWGTLKSGKINQDFNKEQTQPDNIKGKLSHISPDEAWVYVYHDGIRQVGILFFAILILGFIYYTSTTLLGITFLRYYHMGGNMYNNMR